jgi:hypothetical protein
MSKILSFNNNTASGQKISRKGRVTLSYLDFLFVRGLNYFLQGVLHSSSLPDYIEDKKSGGQKTDRLINTSLCNVTTNIIGREARKGRMLKTVNKSRLIGTL